MPSGHAPDGLRLYDPSDALPEQFPYFLYSAGCWSLCSEWRQSRFVYVAARLHAGAVAGLTAGAFVAVSNLHVTQSRFLTPDVPTTAGVAAVLLLTVVAVRRPSDGWFVAAGFVAGLAGGTKWNALAIFDPAGRRLACDTGRHSRCRPEGLRSRSPSLPRPSPALPYRRPRS